MQSYLVLLAFAALSAAIAWAGLWRLGRLRQTWRRWAEGAGFAVLFLFAAIPTAAGFWNAALSARYFSAPPSSGRILTVDGYRTHFFCTGKGSPTVVLEAGFGSDLDDWRLVQTAVSKVTTVCSYDRAGYGWSEARGGIRDADAIARNLHALLRAAKIATPAVLVGHSMGGVYVRRYAALYPEDVAGMVLVDAATPLQEARLDPALNAFSERQIAQLRWMSYFGVFRLMGMCNSFMPGLTRAESEDMCRPALARTLKQEMSAFHASGLETVHDTLGDKPLLVLSHDNTRPILPASFGADRARRFEAQWNGMQEDLTRLSPQSRRVIVGGSGHNIQIERPDVLNRELMRFVEQIRRGERIAPAGTTAE
jgi:pimeloyl-ACP methyl ester carboxylesterase